MCRLGLPSTQISYIPAALGLQTPTLTPAGEQRYFEYPLTPQPMPTAGPHLRDSLLQRSRIDDILLENFSMSIINLGANGLDFFQADALAAQYLQPTSPSPGLPIAVNTTNIQ